MTAHHDEVSRMLARLAARVRNQKGSVSLLTLDQEPELVSGWAPAPLSLGEALSPGVRSDAKLTELVAKAAEHCSLQQGRRFMVVLTDGRDAATGSEWQDAIAAAQTAGTPVRPAAQRSSSAQRCQPGSHRLR